MTTPRQRTILLCVAAACAATRFLAVARSPWDWDELLFCHALRDYDVAQHHPHPPGFPLFIGLAKLVRFFIDSDFRALQAITVVASLLVFPAVYFFARTIGLRFETSLSAGVLCALFPTVWFFGGTAFTDIPSMVLVTSAAALFLRNRYWSGTVLLALAIGIRPQNLLIGLIPGLIATRKRKAWEVLLALLVGTAIVAAIYGAAMQATGVERFREAFRAQSDYVLHNDSFLNPERPSPFNLLERFFLKPYGPTHLSILLSLFVAVALFARSRPALLALATFGPFALFAWLMLDRFQVTRYAIAYAPMLAILVAIGIATIARNYELAASAAVALLLILWTVPALTQVRTRLSPAVAAIEELRRVQPRSLFVGHSMMVFVDYYLPGTKYERVIDFRGLPVRWEGEPWLLADTTSRLKEHNRLWSILRRQYFAAELAPVPDLPRFVAGWDEQRVMRTSSTTILPPRTGEQLLRLDLHTPAHVQATLTVTMNGKTLDV
ncbi:MAG: hypothetical protein QOJ98_1203, partial [Acidobacteriota bacterium]|nr:hypothetical protein [Acidobacteriota bacterium]